MIILFIYFWIFQICGRYYCNNLHKGQSCFGLEGGGGGVWELVGEGWYTHIKEEPNPTKGTSVYIIPYTHTVPFSTLHPHSTL